MSANERQVAGQHYAAQVQHWDYVIGALDSRYLEGNITKYVCRHRKKNGVQDLQKALHYLDKLIESAAAGKIFPPSPLIGGWPFLPEFLSSNGLNTDETYICVHITRWETAAHLYRIKEKINLLIGQAHEDQRRADAEKCGLTLPDMQSSEPGRPYTNQG